MNICRYLSQGTSMQALAWTFHVGLTTIHKIIHETCAAIWDTLSPIYLKSPSTEGEWLNIAAGFEERWNFPHCIGAIDGKHINIEAPAKSGSLYYNYKKRFSIVLLAACDSTYLFKLIDIGGYGSQSDGSILRHSIFGERMEKGHMCLPKARPISPLHMPIPYYLIGDEAFPLKEYLIRAYPGRNLGRQQKIFNYRLSRARQVIENTFGILVARWRLLKTTINANVKNVDNIIKAIVVLHNYCHTEFNGQIDNLYCPQNFTDSNNEENGGWRQEGTPLQSVGRLGANVAQRRLYHIRDMLAEYFDSPTGTVPWQNNLINRNKQFH